MTKRITVAQAKGSLGKGKGTGKKGWLGAEARDTIEIKLNARKI